MKQGKDIIVDETNTTAARRKPLISLAKKYDYYVTCNVIETSLETCLSRAYADNNENLAVIIYRMIKQFELPSKDEDIDEINMV